MNAKTDKRLPKVGIVVLNYRNYADTIQCLESIYRGDYPNYDVIVVDNDSQNESLGHIRRYLEKRVCVSTTIDENGIDDAARLDRRTILLQSSRNGGYAAGNNLGIRTALARDAEYVLLLNNDTEVDTAFLSTLVEYLEANARAGVAGPKVLNRDGSISRACARRRPNPWFYTFYFGLGRLVWRNNPWVRRYHYEDEYDFNEARPVDLLSGCCMLIRARVFQDIGLLDENTFLLQEEAILHERLRTTAWETVVVPHSIVIHKHGGSTSGAPSEAISRAKRESIQYYLIHYRKFSRFSAWIVMWLSQVPSGVTKRCKAFRKWLYQ